MTHEPTSSTSTRPSGLRLTGLAKRLGGRTIVQDLNLDIAPGELICLLGPSGCGKTTTLRMVGGFLTPDGGQMRINGIDYTHAPPEKRPTAMVFQNYALWPHKSVAANIAFGLTLRKLSRAAVSRKVDWALDLVDLAHHKDTMPSRISGGEQQRVALARALVLEPQVLLMDEPLSNLDAKLRLKVRDDIRQIQQRLGITTILVTHDQDEAMSMADRIAVMNSGRIEQYATPSELYSAPRTVFVSEFIGTMNLLPGGADPGRIAMADGRMLFAPAAASVHGDRVGIRPEDIAITATTEPGSTAALVSRVIPRGHYQEVVLDCGGTPLRCFTSVVPTQGSEVGIKVGRAVVYSAGILQSSPGAPGEPAGLPESAADNAPGAGRYTAGASISMGGIRP